LTGAALPDKAAADEAMGPGRTEEEATAGLVVFLAESWRRVLTTISSISHIGVGRGGHTPYWIRTGGGHDTGYHSCAKVNHRTIQ